LRPTRKEFEKKQKEINDLKTKLPTTITEKEISTTNLTPQTAFYTENTTEMDTVTESKKETATATQTVSPTNLPLD
jgi:hypothetical protein